jgi:hypothetical protein
VVEKRTGPAEIHPWDQAGGRTDKEEPSAWRMPGKRLPCFALAPHLTTHNSREIRLPEE